MFFYSLHSVSLLETLYRKFGNINVWITFGWSVESITGWLYVCASEWCSLIYGETLHLKLCPVSSLSHVGVRAPSRQPAAVPVGEKLRESSSVGSSSRTPPCTTLTILAQTTCIPCMLTETCIFLSTDLLDITCFISIAGQWKRDGFIWKQKFNSCLLLFFCFVYLMNKFSFSFYSWYWKWYSCSYHTVCSQQNVCDLKPMN